MVSVVGPVSEANRLRETFRYDSALIATTVPNNPQQPLPASQLRSSSDAALTAFAQLAVLRLGASRALISLFDSTNQYVVAEATPDISLRPRDPAANYPLWLSGTSIPRSFGVCDHVLKAQPGVEHNKEDGLPIYVVNDLAQDERFADRPFVKCGWPQCRFFAGVPIRSRHGVDIGVFSVFGDEPRAGLEALDMSFMRELSLVIMNHLEAERASIAKRLSEHMIRGVGKFVDGSIGLAGKSARYSSRLNHQHVDANSEATTTRDQTLPKTPILHDYTSPNLSVSPPAGIGVTPQLHPLMASPSIIEKEDPLLTATQPAPQPPLQNESSTTPKNRTGDDYVSQAWNIFSKASQIMRESMEIEGAVFLETKLSSFSGRDNVNWPFHTHGSSSSSSSSDDSSLPTVSTSGDEVGGACSPVNSSSAIASSIEGNSASHIPFKLPEKFLRKLIRRYPRGNIFNFDEYGSEQSSDWSSEEAATGSQDGKRSPTEDGQVRPLGMRSRMKQSEQEMLLKMLPGARCIAFAPVWDPQEQRWFAGSFAYTKMHTRVFTVRGDLSYLIAFGTVAMAEVSRLRATLADKSKMDMLSSLSHELRSPLHGIVLGVELLHDTSLDRFQRDVLHTVETCGRTLLDTVNHLLDWAKINNLSTKQLTKSASAYGRGTTKNLREDGLAATTIAANMISINANVSIDVLAEEVVESVFAGHTYQKLAVARSTKATPVGHDRNVLRRLDGMQAAMDDRSSTTHKSVTTSGSTGVDVSLCIDPTSSWMFHTQAGAMRRIIMNLLGNSLKYTEKGFVALRITQSPYHSSHIGRSRAHRNARTVNIVVSDSGRGMSEDYLQNHLFVPFSQEDRMSPGVGLGLSLVKRITTALGGKVRVQSKVGQGTTITVCLPLEKVSASSLMHITGDGEQAAQEFDSRISSLKGLKIRLTGFNTTKKLNRISPGAGDQSDTRSVLANTCRKWLSMHILESPEAEGSNADLILCSEDHLDSISGNRMGTLVPTPIVVICSNALAGRETEAKWRESTKEKMIPGHDMVIFISQPAGPRKLAKALASSIQRRQEMIAASIPPELTPPADTEPDSINLRNNAIEELGSHQASDGTLTTPCSSPSLPTTPEPDLENTQKDPYTMRSKFLLVDDNPINIKILSSCMDRMGLPHDTARDGREAVTMFREGAGRYKCIFMDITMPVMNGFEATCLIRQQEREAEIPACYVIALTGLASLQAQDEALASGIDLFLTKPVKIRDLKQILELRGLI